MSESNKRTIFSVINTLDQIEVKGEDNLDMLLASIRVLKALAKGEDENG